MTDTSDRDKNFDDCVAKYSHVTAEHINRVLTCLVSLGFHIDIRKDDYGFPKPTKSYRKGCQKIYIIERDKLSIKYVIFNCGHHPHRVVFLARFFKKTLSPLNPQALNADINKLLELTTSTIIYKADFNTLLQKASYESDFSAFSFKTFVNSFNDDYDRLKLYIAEACGTT